MHPRNAYAAWPVPWSWRCPPGSPCAAARERGEMEGRVPGAGEGAGTVSPRAGARGMLVLPLSGDCPRRLLGNKGAGRGRRAQGTQGSRGRDSPPAHRSFWKMGPMRNGGGERSTGSWCIQEDTGALASGLGRFADRDWVGLWWDRGRGTALCELRSGRSQGLPGPRKLPSLGTGTLKFSFIH